MTDRRTGISSGDARAAERGMHGDADAKAATAFSPDYSLAHLEHRAALYGRSTRRSSASGRISEQSRRVWNRAWVVTSSFGAVVIGSTQPGGGS